MAGTFDTQIRRTSVLGAKEIKASTNYAYIVNGITLDGSKWAAGATVLEGTCLVKDNVTGKYEPYADGAVSPAVLNGTTNITVATQAGLAADTKVDIYYNGDIFTITNAQLKTITGASTVANVVDLVKNAANGEGAILDNVANIRDNGGKIQIATDNSGGNQSLIWDIVYTVAADNTSVENLFGLTDGATDTGTGAFPEGKSNPVILDQSVKFNVKDSGANPDVVCGQVLVRGDVWKGQLVGWTQAFQDKLAGAIRIL